MIHYLASIPLHLWILISAIGICVSSALAYVRAKQSRLAYKVLWALAVLATLTIGYALGW